jgi:hypothetical protein
MASELKTGPAAAHDAGGAIPIPGQSFLQITRTLQATCGQQYEPLLKAAGLARFLQTPPADDWRPAGTSAELVRLFTVVYDMLGEDLTRLFHRNCNVAIASYILEGQWAAAARAEAAQVPAEQRLAWAVQEIARYCARSWSPHLISEDAGAWYLTNDHCVVCADVRGAVGPFCGTATMFAALAQALVGRRVRGIEVECAAMGAPHCKYALYK